MSSAGSRLPHLNAPLAGHWQPLQGAAEDKALQILIVVVLYKLAPEQSATIAGLCHTFEKHPELAGTMGLLIWDNSPHSVGNPQLPVPFEYRHTGENLGISGAYNHALQMAEEIGCPWLMFLDQDSTITDDVLLRMLDYSREQEKNVRIAVIAPYLMAGDGLISPGVIQINHTKPLPLGISGEYTKACYVANSGMLMRVSSLKSIGGYDENFWLDYSDIVVCHKLYQHGMHAYIAGDVRIQHRLAARDYDNSMSPERYRNGIAAEGAYWDLYRSRLEQYALAMRLLARVFKQYMCYKDKSYAAITLRCLLQRLFTPQSARLRKWKELTRFRQIPEASSEPW